ncbi:glycosyltransferase [Metapseudomonas otitidis]
MKSPAIVSFLWESQLGVLRAFFNRHGPMTVVTLSPYVTDTLTTIIEQSGSRLFVVDHELGDAGAYAVQAEYEPLRERLDGLLRTLPAELAEERVEEVAPVIRTRLDAELPLLTTLLHGLELAQREFQLSLMIGSEDVLPAAKVAMHWARTQGIPSLHLSHALALNDPHTVHAQLVADIHAVYGQRGLEGYLDYGIPAERMRVTGNPAWDRLVPLRGERARHEQSLRQRHHLREGAPIVVFGTTWTSSLTAHGDEGIFGQTLGAFLAACEAVRRSGLAINPVIKDRPPNYHFGERRFRELLLEHGADPASYLYTVEDAQLWAAASDVLIAVDSNYCVEALLCGTPAINLQHPANTLFGPCYGADAGVLDVEMDELAEALLRLLGDADFREALHARAERGLPYLNLGVDGLATERVVELMGEMARGLVPKLVAWLEARLPSEAERSLIETKIRAVGVAGPLLDIHVLGSERPGALAATLASLERALSAPFRVRVYDTEPMAGVETLCVEGPQRLDVLNEQLLSAPDASPWQLVVEAGVEFTRAGPLLLCLELAEALRAEAEEGVVAHACYADELQRAPSGALGPLFKPDFNLDLLLGFPALVGRHWVFRQRSVVELGGLDTVFGSSSLLDLTLRLVHGSGGNGVLHAPEVLLVADAPVMEVAPAEQVAIERHLAARGYDAARVQAFLPRRYYIDYGHPEAPRVAIVVAVQDNLGLVQRCVESLLEHTTYSNYQLLLVDCGSVESATQDWLQGVDALQSEQVKVWNFDGPFNQAAMVNAVAMTVEADYLLLLSHDVRIIQPEWLEQLLNHAQRPEVGAVGAKILDAEGGIEQAGMVLGLHECAGRTFVGEPGDAPGYMSRLQVAQNYTAVGLACMMVRRSSFIEVGGFDADSINAFYADTDLCLRLRAAGLLNVWTPHCVVQRDGLDLPVLAIPGALERQSAFRGERQEMLRRWLPVLARDPAYNPNLSLKGSGFSFEYPARRMHHPLLPQVVCYPADITGCGHYRIRQPFAALRQAGMVDGLISGVHLPVVELERAGATSLILQRQIMEPQIEGIREVKELSGVFKVYELDDYLPNLPLKSVHRDTMPKDILRSLRQAVALTDRFVVSTEPLAEALRDLHGDIRVVPNFLPEHWWGNLRSQRRRGRKPRVGWAGGSSHLGDLELITDLVKALKDEVEWVFFGMCPERIRPYIHEFHGGVPIEQYPALLASLDLDLALAPLEPNLFNECKSNLRLLEYGACGFPVICTDAVCYRGDLPVTRVKNRYKDWLDAVRMHLADLDATARQGDALRERVLGEWMLKGENLQRWRSAWLPD